MIVVNGRFSLRPPTGVDVHAHEVTARLAGLELAIPPTLFARGLPGHTWEQTALVHRARGETLWSPCNTGPAWSHPHVMTVHDVAVFDRPEFFSRAYRIQAAVLGRSAKRHADVIATVSEYSKHRIVERLGIGPERVRVVGNGVRNEFLDVVPVERRRGGLVTVGSVEPRKGLDRLVTAYRRSGLEMPLSVIGKSDPRIFADAAVRNGGGVVLCGYLPIARMIDEIRGASAFFSLSAYEGFGLPPVEAAALGVPVVVSDIEAHREALGGIAGVRFVTTSDDVVQAMHDAAGGRLEHPDPAEVASRHSWDSVAESYRGIFADELGDPDVALARSEP